jgi:hypothetical protein
MCVWDAQFELQAAKLIELWLKELSPRERKKMAGSANALSFREIAELVPMTRLLEALGFAVNARVKRCACILHSGTNPTAFSWTDSGFWRCHSCGAGGDRIALVRATRRCSFREAVEFLAALARVEYRQGLESRGIIESQKRQRERETVEADSLLARERAAWCEARDVVMQLEGIRRNAGMRLRSMHRGEQERWPGETDLAWEAMADISQQTPRAVAAYSVISFAPAEVRFAFAMDAEAREECIDDALNCGWVADSKGHRFEVLL